ncbi:putative gustatory receptor 2a [Culicoides brevitarsis]|uniref:putative gustatory receptor 2a n=1 Tax=Culicoides brevitarsis TaxID=469753 RepID=UPI00307B8289
MVPLKFFPEETSSICTYFKIFGFFPHASSRATQTFLYITSFLSILLGPIIILNLLLYIRETEHESNIDITAEYFMLVGYVVGQLITNCQALLTKKVQRKIFKIFNGIDYLILRLDNLRDYTSDRSWMIFKMAVISVISVAVPIVQLLMSKNLDVEKIISLLIFLPLLRLRCAQFIFYTDSVKIKLSALNEYISKINLKNSEAERTVVTSDYFNEKKSVDYFLGRMYVMKSIHSKIWKVASTINDCFGLSLLFIISHCFATLTVEAYWCYFSFFGNNPISKAIDSLSTAIPDIFILIFIANSCSGCSDLCTTINSSIHKIENNYEDFRFNAMINDFASQVFQLKVTYTANGFFTIDYSLLGSMVIAIIGYMVILVQFHQEI